MNEPATPDRPGSPPELQLPLPPLPPSQVWATLVPAQQQHVVQVIVSVYRTLLTIPAAPCHSTEVQDDDATTAHQ